MEYIALGIIILVIFALPGLAAAWVISLSKKLSRILGLLSIFAGPIILFGIGIFLAAQPSDSPNDEEGWTSAFLWTGLVLFEVSAAVGAGVAVFIRRIRSPKNKPHDVF